MTFMRTPSGYSNLHLFHDVSAVVYVEGGRENYNLEDVINGSFGKESLDIIYWQNIFTKFAKRKKFKFKALGSKTTLLKIADLIADGKIKKICVAMDRDFDNFENRLKIGPNIIYTYGYSWENDTWHPKVIEEAFYSISPICRQTVKCKKEIIILLKQFSLNLRWAVYGDILLHRFNISFLRDVNPESLILIKDTTNSEPSINKRRIRCLLETIRKKKSQKIQMGAKIDYAPLKDCYGHLLGCFCNRILIHLFRKNTNLKKIQKELLSAIAIGQLKNQLNSKTLKNLKNHYETQFASLQI